MKKTIVALVLVAFLGFNLVFVMTLANAVPRFSARYEQNCNLCHFNPTGGGLRTLYASQFLVPEEMAMKPPSDDVLEGITPEISSSITIGADFRLVHFRSDEKEFTKNFFQMQGDLYINFQMTSRLSLYYDRGMSQSYELYGLGYILPENGYLKLGRFVPAYGWRFDDHTMFTRDYLGFFPPRHTDVGVEAGMYPGRFALHLSLLNGNNGGVQDDNDKMAVVGRAAYRFNVKGVGFALGASGYHNPQTTADQQAAGPFGYLKWKGFTWVGEVDWVRVEPENSGHTTSFVSSHELVYQMVKGVDLKMTYDFHDPDWNLKTGTEERIAGGLVLLPTPFTALELLLRSYRFEQGVDIVQKDYLESVVQFHFLY